MFPARVVPVRRVMSALAVALACLLVLAGGASATVQTAHTEAADANVTAATLHAYVSSDTGSVTFHFDYGTTTAYGTSTPESQPAAGGQVTYQIENLSPGTTYYFRVVATDSAGTVTDTPAGADGTFTTRPMPPADRDGDGTPDSSDRCPDAFGPSTNGGCPPHSSHWCQRAATRNDSTCPPCPTSSVVKLHNADVDGGQFVTADVTIPGPGWVALSFPVEGNGLQYRYFASGGRQTARFENAKPEDGRTRKLEVTASFAPAGCRKADGTVVDYEVLDDRRVPPNKASLTFGPTAHLTFQARTFADQLAFDTTPTGDDAKIGTILKHGGHLATGIKKLMGGTWTLKVFWYFRPAGKKAVVVASGSNKLVERGDAFKLKINLTSRGRALLRKSHTIKLVAEGALISAPEDGFKPALMRTTHFVLRR